MNFLRVTHDGVSSVINLALVIQARYEQSSQQLHIKFTNGETVTLLGEEGERVWMLLSLEAGADDDYDPDEDEVVGDFDIINQEISDLENQVKNNSVTRTWDAQRLRNSADELGNYWTSKKKKELAEEIKGVKARAYSVADEAEISAYTNMVDACLAATFTTSASVKSILRKLNQTEDELKRGKKLTDALKQKIRKGKERAAWYRAKKKLDEARVAEAGGNIIKHDKYRREAEALLRQDWSVIFPSEQSPDVDSFDSALNL
ncbi:MAG: hypothetical protein LC785_15435 [Acidobacteria bacterium]|nr:hypothetical protein [Acidobacteriota bacterium]MCA1643300.1 hypothetical protein [Acidobacteriota bacterium]